MIGSAMVARRVLANGLRLHHLRSGGPAGLPLLLLHGGPGLPLHGWPA